MYQTTPYYPKSKKGHVDLDRNAIKRELHSLNIHLPASFLWEPSAVEAQSFFLSAVEFERGCELQQHLLGGDSDLHSHGLDLLVDLGGWQTSISRLSLLRHAQRVFGEVVGLGDEVSLSDLTHPDPYRMALFSSAFISFVRFKESKSELFAERLTAIQNATADVKKESERLGLLTTEEKAVEEDYHRRTDSLYEINSLHCQMQNDIKTFHEKFMQAQEKLKSNQAESDALSASAANIKTKIEELMQRREVLEREVVRSPRRLKKALDELTIHGDQEQVALKDANDRLAESRARRDVSAVMARTVSKIHNACNRMHASLEKTTAIGGSLKASQREFAVAEREMAVQRENVQYLQMALQKTLEAKRKLEVKQRQEESAYQEELATAENCLQDRKLSLDSQTKLAETLESSCLSNERMTAAVMDSKKQALKVCEDLERRLYKVIDDNVLGKISGEVNDLSKSCQAIFTVPSKHSESDRSSMTRRKEYLTASVLEERQEELLGILQDSPLLVKLNHNHSRDDNDGNDGNEDNRVIIPALVVQPSTDLCSADRAAKKKGMQQTHGVHKYVAAGIDDQLQMNGVVDVEVGLANQLARLELEATSEKYATHGSDTYKKEGRAVCVGGIDTSGGNKGSNRRTSGGTDGPPTAGKRSAAEAQSKHGPNEMNSRRRHTTNSSAGKENRVPSSSGIDTTTTSRRSVIGRGGSRATSALREIPSETTYLPVPLPPAEWSNTSYPGP